MAFTTAHELVLPAPIDGKILSWCPTMDLLVVSVNSVILWVYRFNGQRVYAVNALSKVTGIAWRKDGKAFTLATVDGNCRLYDTNTGKLLSTVFTAGGAVSFVEWSTRTDPPAPHNAFTPLFHLDCTQSFPRIAALEALADETMFDLFFVGLAANTLAVTLYGRFTLEDVAVPVMPLALLLGLVSLRNLHRHYLFVGENQTLALYELDLSFLLRFGDSLQAITLTSARILGVLLHLKDAITTFVTDAETLVEAQHQQFQLLVASVAQTTPTTSTLALGELYALLLTGIASTGIHEWLVTELGERGLKRQARLNNQALDALRRTAFHTLVPAVELLLALLAKLQGHAQWEERSHRFGLSAEGLTQTIAHTGALLESIHVHVWTVNEEQRLFGIYSDWLTTTLAEATSEDSPGFTGRASDVSQYLRSHLATPTVEAVYADGNLYTGIATIDETLQEIFTAVKDALKAQIRFSEPVVLSRAWDDSVTLAKPLVTATHIHMAAWTQLGATLFRLGSASGLERALPALLLLHGFEYIDDKEALVLTEVEGSHAVATLDHSVLSYAADANLQVATILHSELVGNEPRFLSLSRNPERRVGCLVSGDRKRLNLFSLQSGVKAVW